MEKQTARLEATAAESVRHNIHFLTVAHIQTVFSESIDFAQGSQSPEDDSDIEWRFTKQVCLPQNLDACSQSISAKHIKISHELVVTAQFDDEAGQKTTQVLTHPSNFRYSMPNIRQMKSILPFKIHMTPHVIGEDASVHGQDIRQMQGNRSPPPAYSDHFSDLVVPTAADVDLFEHPMLTEISPTRSSSEQSTPILAVPPAPRYEQVV